MPILGCLLMEIKHYKSQIRIGIIAVLQLRNLLVSLFMKVKCYSEVQLELEL